MASFYGWSHEYIEEMDYGIALEYYEAISVIEAQDALINMKVVDHPRANAESRKKFHRDMKKVAYPQGLQREMEFEEFIEVMRDGG